MESLIGDKYGCFDLQVRVNYRMRVKIFIKDGFDDVLRMQCDPKSSGAYFRISFNPSKVRAREVRPYVDYVLSGGYTGLILGGRNTRLDLSVDVNHANMDSLLVWHPKITKTAAYSGSGMLETIYLGSTDSSKRICIYNKRLEIIRKNKKKIFKCDVPSHDVVRIEYRLTGGGSMAGLLDTPNPFKSIELAYSPSPILGDPIQMLLLEACRSVGSVCALQMIQNPEQRKKYRKRIFKSNPSWWNPTDIWSQWPQVISKVTDPGKSLFNLDVPENIEGLSPSKILSNL
jgi:hypothetical protein